MIVFSIQQKPVDMDLGKLILKNAVVITRSLAADGYIIDPAGLDLKHYLQNPVVEARHGKAQDGEPSVIGRALEVRKSDLAIEATTQFADTRRGREYAYLYGLNETGDVFARAWSVDLVLGKQAAISRAAAQRIVPAEWWDDLLADKAARNGAAIRVAWESQLTSYSAVAIGADRGALSRAWMQGVDTAGLMLATLDLQTASEELVVLKRSQEEQGNRLASLESDIQALRRDGSAAAARGDTAELLYQVRELTREIKNQNQKEG